MLLEAFTRWPFISVHGSNSGAIEHHRNKSTNGLFESLHYKMVRMLGVE